MLVFLNGFAEGLRELAIFIKFTSNSKHDCFEPALAFMGLFETRVLNRTKRFGETGSIFCLIR